MAERVQDKNDLSVYVKGVISPFAYLNIDIASEKAEEIGLLSINNSEREIVVDISKNPEKDEAKMKK